MIKTSFAHVGLNCRDISITAAFYTKHFGFEVVRVVPLGKARIVFMKSGSARLELFEAKGRAAAVKGDGPTEPGFRHMAFSVPNVEAKLKEMGKDARVTLGPAYFDAFIKGWGAAWIRDPDGRIVEISQGYKDEKRAKK
ncbi:MAG: VOC family protein [Acidobacteria bacterium]|nr:VOC family protein [Acidobacteriota bacterium]